MGVTDRLRLGLRRPSLSPGRHTLFPTSPNSCLGGHSQPVFRKTGRNGVTNMNEPESMKVSVGIDVSKSMLDMAIHETGESWSCSNDASGCAALVPKLRELKATRIVLEATGGFETLVTATLSAADLPVIVVNPLHVRE